ncbi:tail protein [Microbacterium phage Kaijohn]|uniref:Minor tail protein n=1 Tax=Microbacterium phage Kaijohn TaxID=2653750 RepID=A0A5Q2WGM5_9CAUD|nr:tail protein [Microbacterium phage Kaijohn]QGH78535.1 minor tail protein [Microbacterium phage Kaijohn]
MALRQLEEAVRSLQRRVGEILQQLAPVGTIHAFAGPVAPANYVLMDGRQLSRADYPALFALIGTTYGAGNGTTTFHVPDARGRALVALDTAQAEFNAMGKTGGAKTVALTAAQNGKHSHLLNAGGQAHAFSWGGAGGTTVHVQNAIAAVGAPPSNNLTTHQNAWNRTADDGAGEAHNNLQPFLTVAYVIKAK